MIHLRIDGDNGQRKIIFAIYVEVQEIFAEEKKNMDEKKINYAKLGRLLFYGNWAAQKFHDHHCPYFPCKYNDNPVHAVSQHNYETKRFRHQ